MGYSGEQDVVGPDLDEQAATRRTVEETDDQGGAVF